MASGGGLGRADVTGLARRVLHKLGIYRRLIVIGGRDVRRPPPPKLPLELAVLGAEEMDEYLAYRSDADAAEIRRRFGDGQWCYAARHEGRLVASGWAARDRVWVEHVDCWLRLRDDCVFVHDDYVRPELRGRSLTTAVEDFRRRSIEAAGFERIVAVILPLNSAASRHNSKRNAIGIGDLRCWRLGPWCRHSLRLRPSRQGPMLVLEDPRGG